MLKKPNPAAVTSWLFICCSMIFVMALLGAITRLTESGLSMTSWEPIMGAIPPLTQGEWEHAFAAYQQIPQYQILNNHMSLEEFKSIFFWEWFHRLWGRLIGLVFVLPLIYFVIKKQISKQMGFRFFLIFLLGGFQGFIGWFMVESGLSVRTTVSPYRLALHLGFALLIYSLLLWMALSGRKKEGGTKILPAHLYKQGWITLCLLVFTMIWGAFVAGFHAGEIYNTWPSMDGEFFPSAATTLVPQWTNFLQNAAFIQFTHRWLGPLTMLTIWGWAFSLWKHVEYKDRGAVKALAFISLLQVGLGITTLLTHAEVAIAVLHQAGAITLLSLMLFNLNLLSYKTRSKRLSEE